MSEFLPSFRVGAGVHPGSENVGSLAHHWVLFLIPETVPHTIGHFDLFRPYLRVPEDDLVLGQGPEGGGPFAQMYYERTFGIRS